MENSGTFFYGVCSCQAWAGDIIDDQKWFTAWFFPNCCNVIDLQYKLSQEMVHAQAYCSANKGF
jgi:hypothetical protein